MRDEAVPEVCAELAALDSAAVRNRFALDILAAYTGLAPTHRIEKVKTDAPRVFASPRLARTLPVDTPIMPRPFVSSNAPTSSSASPNAMRFVSLRSSVCAYASLALRALAWMGVVSYLAGPRRTEGGGERLNSPPATTSLLGAIIRYGESFHHLRWRRRGQSIEVLLDLFSELLSIITYKNIVTRSRG